MANIGERDPAKDDLANMNYLDMFIKEGNYISQVSEERRMCQIYDFRLHRDQ